ncbi:MAG TPA: TIGR03986 family CRISPR-associated RAMP protein [Thermoanaerobaculia bacterium]|jgi:CRISPR-associated protein (TIGR03986 family)
MSPHVNPTKPERTFFAAYNFIPLPDKVLSVSEDTAFDCDAGGSKKKVWEVHDRFLHGTLSGWIDLDIKTETPLYIRCGVAPEHAADPEPRSNPHRQEFFHHGEPPAGDPLPVIPGSSLRGMVRGLVEIASFGKVQWFSGAGEPKRLAYRGVADSSSMGKEYRAQLNRASLRGGYLHISGDQWSIRPATTINNASFVRVRYTDVPQVLKGTHQCRSVFVKAPHGSGDHAFPVAEAVRLAEEKGFEPATLVVSGDIKGKTMHCAIYAAQPGAAELPIPDEMRRTYLDDHRSIHKRSVPGSAPRELGNEGDPLFYLVGKKGELVYFGPTLMFRMSYAHTIGDFVPAGLRRESDIDLAEAIFGRVGNEGAIKGRVRFEDAKATAATFLDTDGGRRSPLILGAPKPTSFQLYLEQDQPDDPLKLRHWGSDPKNTRIRGSKRYWHRRNAGENRFEKQLMPASKQHTIIRPVDASSHFAGRIQFDNLLPVELGALLFVLELPETMRHQLGMAKARGLGSVEIRPALTLIDRDGRYRKMFGGDGAIHEAVIGADEAGKLAKDARKQFVRCITAFVGLPRVEDIDLWQLPRLAALGVMLRWEGAPLENITSPKLGDSLWRQRAVLPTPYAVAGVEPPREIGPVDIKTGATIEVRLRSDTTRKGGPKFDIIGTGRVGVLHSRSDPLPENVKPGDSLLLVVRADDTMPQLAWIDPEAPPAPPPKTRPPNRGR